MSGITCGTQSSLSFRKLEHDVNVLLSMPLLEHTDRRRVSRKIGTWDGGWGDGGSGPGSDCLERLLGRELGNEIFLLANDPIIFEAIRSL